jgi:hypothetical protein
MKKVVLFIAGAAWATGAYAQQAPAPTVDLAGSLKAQHLSIRKYLAGAAEKMPEADFHFKPQGTAPEGADVRADRRPPGERELRPLRGGEG